MSQNSSRLRPRLAAVVEAIPQGSRVADIGSDHGRLPRLLIASGRAAWCLATERSSGPERRLRAAVDSSPEADRIDVRRGDGLEPLRAEDRLDGLVLSGMGGPTMLSILDRERLAELGIRWLVLQPQSGWGGLRRGLERLGWSVDGERLVRDRDRFYTVMRAQEGAETIPAPPGFSAREWFEIGPCWFRDRESAALEYWAERSARAEQRLRRVRGAGLTPARAECELARRALAALESSRLG